MADKIKEIKKNRRSSTGTMEEFLKKKREREEGEGEKYNLEEIFRKSKKIVRSPEGKKEEEQEEREEEERDGGFKGGIIREEMKEGWRNIKEEIMEMMRKQLKEEIDKIRGEWLEREKKWEEEKREVLGRIEELDREIRRMREEKEKEEKEGREEGRRWEREEKREEGKTIDRIEELERKWEWEQEKKEREKRSRNIVIKGLKVGGEEKEIRKGVEEVIKEIGVEVEIKGIRKIEAGRKERGEMVIVETGSEKERWEILMKKSRLRGQKIWIEKDETWKERRARWSLRQIVMREEAKGKRVWIMRGRVQIEGKWWIWDDQMERLKDNEGRWRKEEEGEGKRKEEIGNKKGGD